MVVLGETIYADAVVVATGGQNLWNNKTLRYRMRFEHESLDGIWMAPKNGYYWHNTLNWMPKDKYRNEHSFKELLTLL